MGARNAIDDAVYQRLRTDPGLPALCGGAWRVYHAYDEAERLLDETNHSYVVVQYMGGGKKTGKRQRFLVQLAVFSIRQYRAKNLWDYVEGLLNAKPLAATGWTDVAVAKLSDRALYDDAAGAHQIVGEFAVEVF